MLFKNFSFGTASLILMEKAAIPPLFPRACDKTNRVLSQAPHSLIREGL
jgi:hypothetical protein